MLENIDQYVWVFTHTYDAEGRVIKLDPSGKIYGQQHTNEYYWEIKNDELYFKNIEGQLSGVFNLHEFDGKHLNGKFLLWDNSGIDTRLTKSDNILVLDEKSIYDISDEVITLAEGTFVSVRDTFYCNAIHQNSNYNASKINLVILRNVQVLNMYGNVRKDSYIASESLQHFPFHLDKQVSKISDRAIAVRNFKTTVKIRRAIYAIHGASGNYYHWMILFISKIVYYCENRNDFDDCIVIISEYLSDYQKRSAEIVCDYYKLPIVQLQGDSSADIEELLFPHEEHSIGIEPHPSIMKTFDLIKTSVAREKTDISRLVYISRSDTSFRKLENEKNIEAILTSFGFDIVHLSGKTLDTQVNILKNTDVVISPHGAGLTNIVFCNPGTKILEFQSPRHVNWCMKNLANIAGLEYGFIMGRTTSQDQYTIDESELLSALEKIGISNTGT